MRLLLLALLLLPLAACDDGDGRFSRDSFEKDDLTGEYFPEEKDDQYAIHSRGDEIKLGLTDDVIYVRLSDATLDEVDAEMERETAEETGFGAMIAGAVTAGVSDLLRNRLEFDVAAVRDIRFDDGTITLEMEDGSSNDAVFNNDDGDALFARRDAEAFIEAFHKVKGRR